MDKFKGGKFVRLHAVIIFVFTILLSLVIIWFGSAVILRVNSVEQLWQTYNQHTNSLSQSLNEIRSSFGYGGFIHNFKNLILRRDKSLIPQLEKDLKKTYQELDRLESNLIDEHQKEAVARFRYVVDNYARNFKLATQLIVDDALSTKDIDKRVKVNDQPAIEALEQLHNIFVSVGKDVEFKTTQELDAASEFTMRGLLFIPVLIINAFVLIFYLQRLTRANRELTLTKQYSDDLIEAAPDALFIIDSKGKIVQTNIQAERLFGYNRDELRGMIVEQLIPERYRFGHVSLRSQSHRYNVERPMYNTPELQALHRDGKEFPVEISLSFSRQAKGMFSIAILRDVSARKKSEQILRRSENMLNQAQQIAGLGSWEWNIETGVLGWSDEVFRILGCDPQSFEPSFEQFLTYVHPDDRQRVREAVESAIAKNEDYKVEHRILRDDGEELVVVEEGKVFVDDESSAYMLSTILDITERSRAAARLNLAKQVFDNSLEAIAVMDNKGRIMDINYAFTLMTGQEREALIGHMPTMLMLSRQENNFETDLWQVITSNEHWKDEIWNRHQEGGLTPIMASFARVCGPQGEVTHYIGTFFDISAMKETQHQLESLAHYDQLTHLSNRFNFFSHLKNGLARAQRYRNRVAIIYIDLDGFKQVNDIFGHDAGDDLLVKAANLLRSCVREGDVVARFGGDEFVILLQDEDSLEQIETVAKRILSSLNIDVEINGRTSHVSASVGIAVYPDHGTDEQELVNHADQAMYQAKRAGKNGYAMYSAEVANMSLPN